MSDLTRHDEPRPTGIPACSLCAPHAWHGLPCTHQAGFAVVWGMPAQPQTCGCPGEWAAREEAS